MQENGSLKQPGLILVQEIQEAFAALVPDDADGSVVAAGLSAICTEVRRGFCDGILRDGPSYAPWKLALRPDPVRLTIFLILSCLSAKMS